MNKAKQLIIALICGYDRDHALVKTALSDGAALGKDLLETTVITKADLFSMTESGDSIFQFKETWANLQKLIDYFQSTGEPLTGADLRIPIAGNKSAMDYAKDNSTVDSVLTVPSLWTGHFEEFRDSWFRNHNSMATQEQYQSLKKAIYQLEGRVTREDQLAAIGIKFDEVHKAINSGDYKEINQKFAAGGDHLRREDLFLVDWAGDHFLYDSGAWEHAGKLWAELAKNNELPTVEDFHFRCGDRKTVIERALDTRYYCNIFDYTLWGDRPISDVMAVYAMIPEDKRKDAKIEPLLDKMAEKIFMEQIGDGSSLTHADLVEPMNSKLHSELGIETVRPLGFENILKQLDAVQAALAENGESLSLEDLRQTSGVGQDTILMIAARSNHFDKVLDVLAQTGEKLALSDLTAKGKDSKTILEVLSGHDALPLLLKPQDWVGRGEELGKLWKAMRDILPTKTTDAIDFSRLQSNVSLLTVRHRFARPAGPAGPAP